MMQSASRYVVLMLALHAGAWANADELPQRVATVFKTHCVRCHNDRQRQGELSLQSRASLLAGGENGQVVEAGDPDASYLLDLITPDDGQAAMPKDGAALAAEEIDAIQRWIAGGAKWPANLVIAPPRWWSLRPVQRPALPALSSARRAWTRNAIDRFIAARHEARKFVPAPSADRRTWLRRVNFDLIGLPPTRDELDVFLSDPSPNAWESAVDRLLASPALGERWARHWLDVVRFSESNGFEDDAPRPHAWPYRDYVIRSFNADTPYDQFVREQLAGDVLQPVTHDGIEATGFLVAGPWDHAAAVAASQVEQLRAREVQMDEMLSAVSQTFLGLTVNCARCHDHKFDPILQTDYYALKAVFEGVDQANGANRSASLVLTAEQRAVFDQRQTELNAAIARQRRALQRVDERREALADETNPPPLNRAVAMWQFAAGDEQSADASTAPDLKGGQSNLAGKWSLRFDQPSDQPIAALNADQRLVDTGPGTLLKNQPGGAGYAIIPNLTGSELLPRPQTSMTLFARVRFMEGFHGVDDIVRIGSSPSEHRDTIGLEFVAQGEAHDAARVHFVTLGKDQQAEQALLHPHLARLGTWYDVTAVFESLPQAAGGRMTVYVFDPNTGKQMGAAVSRDVSYDTLESGGVQNLLFFVAPSFRNGPQPGAQMELAAIWHQALSPRDVAALSATEKKAADQIAKGDRPLRDEADTHLKSLAERLKREIEQLQAESKRHRESTHKAFIGVRRRPPKTVLFQRGDVRQPGAIIAPAALSAIQVPSPTLKMDDAAADGDRRQAFARWLTHAEHPLTARVIVNRLWHYHFGRGLVETPSDLGASGRLPSHPELLDWLAAELVEHDWSLKHIHRLIVTSATYRMRSNWTHPPSSRDADVANPAASDADNRLLWRFPLRRLEAETVRDAMLAVSGELNRQMHGPSVQPFEVTRFNTYFYSLFDRDEPAYNRRTVYRMNVNTGRDPLLDALDCPAPSVMTPVRRETTTPLQALALMNGAFALRQAQRLAERVTSAARMKSPQTAGEKTGLAEPIEPERIEQKNVELKHIELAWSLAIGRQPDDQEVKLSEQLIATADLRTLCWTLLNSSEFLFVK